MPQKEKPELARSVQLELDPVQKKNLKIKKMMAKELLSLGLTKEVVARILNLRIRGEA